MIVAARLVASLAQRFDFVQPGKVYLVGAGPGHPELLTLKAAELLRTGDVVIYDRLVQQEILTFTKPSAERIYMGKAEGRHDSRQDEILELLVRKAAEGKVVIRLKGGDPFVFGRGAEEAEYLAEHGVPFEVIPGVSASIAAPESAGIPLTHRDFASSFAVVTGHEASRDSSRLNWDALAGIDTLVFLMGVHNVAAIARGLMERGRDPGTPVAMVQQAFWHGERVIIGTLATIADDVLREGIEPPATLVVGDVVRVREKLKEAQRDLRRREGAGEAFSPAPAPDQLLRLATGGVASQVLRFALGASLFDDLEQWCTGEDLSASLKLNSQAVGELLECLVSLGLVESGPGGYRNLEIASRYLVTSSEQSLKPTLLYQTSLGEPWVALTRYLQDENDPHRTGVDERLYEEAADCVARFSAPFAVEKIDWEKAGHVLIAGWGAEGYRQQALRRWPQLSLEVMNPFQNGLERDPARSLPHGPYDSVLLSGMLESCVRGQVVPMLEAVAMELCPNGTLYLRDGFFPACAVSPAEVVLPALGRHVARGGCRNWPISRLSRTLSKLGFESIRSNTLPGGSLLVSARKA